MIPPDNDGTVGALDEKVRTCPYCKTVSTASATKCRECGRLLEPVRNRPLAKTADTDPASEPVDMINSFESTRHMEDADSTHQATGDSSGGQPDIPRIKGIERTSIRLPAVEEQQVERFEGIESHLEPAADEEEPEVSLLDLEDDPAEMAGRSFRPRETNAEAGTASGVPRPMQDRRVHKPHLERPVLQEVSDRQAPFGRRRGDRIKRLVARVLPQVLAIAALVFFGQLYIDNLMLQGTWQGVMADKQGKNVPFELTLERRANEVWGEVVFTAPDAGEEFSKAGANAIPKVVRQVFMKTRGEVEGEFSLNYANLVLFGSEQNTEPSLRLEGSFVSRDEIQGRVINSFQKEGVFVLQRVP